MESDFITQLKSQFSTIKGSYSDIGDDGALVPNFCGRQVIATDTLNAGVHFNRELAPELLAQKAISVNVSDMLAMAAKPRFFLLNISMPSYDKTWSQQFISSLYLIANKYGLNLLGGDTCKGELSISITIIGEVIGKLLTRGAATAGEKLLVTGNLGNADCCYRNNLQVPPSILKHNWQPQLPFEFILQAKQYLQAAIDISDGLVADAQHIAEASSLHLKINCEQLPVAPALLAFETKQGKTTHQVQQQAAVGGEDYQILFTAKASNIAILQKLAKNTNTNLTTIGEVLAGSDACLYLNNNKLDLEYTGYKHFDND